MFDVALPVILANEGGYADNPNDPGGATMRGITQTTYSNWLQSTGQPFKHVRNITDGEVEEIYRSKYWEAAHCDDLAWPLALAHFDAAVNHGVSSAIKMLQGVAGAHPDGIWGPRTEQHVASVDPDVLLWDLLWARLRFYANLALGRPESREFLAGWVLRTVRLRERCLSEIAAHDLSDANDTD